MNKAVSAVMGGAAAAATIGTAVYMMNRNTKGMRKMRRGAAKTAKAVGSIANGISGMMR